MPSGIYQLEFETGERYIGQSVDIHQRWKQHADKLQKGTAAKPMQDAYHRSGYDLPRAAIVIECHPDLLDEYEGMYINLWRPELNTSIPGRREDWEYEQLEKYTRTKEGVISGVPALISTVFAISEELEEAKVRQINNFYDMRQERDDAVLGKNKAVKELTKIQDNWNDKITIEAGKSEAFRKLEHGLRQERLEHESLRVRVNKASWWQRLWNTW